MLWKKALKLTATGLTVVVAVFVLQKLVVVTPDDVAGHYEVGRPQPDFQVQGGSIYAFSPDLARRPEWLCSTQLKDENIERRVQNVRVQNSLAAALPFIDWIVSKASSDAPSTKEAFRTEIEFNGVYTKLMTNASGEQPKACEERMVRLAAQGFRICRVRSTLIAQGDAVFAAFNFDSDQIYIPQETFATYDIERTDRVDKNAALPCPPSRPLSWDAMVRQKLKLVTIADLFETAEVTVEG